jgi:hypothetical protein
MPPKSAAWTQAPVPWHGRGFGVLVLPVASVCTTRKIGLRILDFNAPEALVAVGALCLGVLAIVRGQVWLGACFIGPCKPEPPIRLNLEDDSTGPDGADAQQADHR